jgi:hypothetical protein
MRSSSRHPGWNHSSLATEGSVDSGASDWSASDWSASDWSA